MTTSMTGLQHVPLHNPLETVGWKTNQSVDMRNFQRRKRKSSEKHQLVGRKHACLGQGSKAPPLRLRKKTGRGGSKQGAQQPQKKKEGWSVYRVLTDFWPKTTSSRWGMMLQFSPKWLTESCGNGQNNMERRTEEEWMFSCHLKVSQAFHMLGSFSPKNAQTSFVSGVTMILSARSSLSLTSVGDGGGVTCLAATSWKHRANDKWIVIDVGGLTH